MPPRFFSLKWKFVLIFSSVFLFLLTLFSYKLYQDTAQNFEIARQKKAASHQFLARALTRKSFDNFSQVVDLLFTSKPSNTVLSNLNFIDKNWPQWRILGDMENTLLFSREGKLLHRWGSALTPSSEKIHAAIQQESPQKQLDCVGACFQQTIVPLIGHGELVAVVSMARKFTDVIIEYNHISGTDMGVLIETNARLPSHGSYVLSGLSNSSVNKKLFTQIQRYFTLAALLKGKNVIELDQHFYELQVFSVDEATPNQAPFFMIIEDITEELKTLTVNIQKIILFGSVNFLASVLLLLVVVKLSLNRIALFSAALPYLARQKYSVFKDKVRKKPPISLGYDEINLLQDTALAVCNQLELLEKTVAENTQQLIEKTVELAAERDFIQQLIEVAPIIILIQNIKGDIMAINQAGLDEFAIDKAHIIGQPFDHFIPSIETEHHRKLKQLREEKVLSLVKIEGGLLTDQGNCHIAWLHSLINRHQPEEKFLLTLGINITDSKRAQEEMLKMATEDPLTGLANRRMFQTELTNRLFSAKRYGFSLALLYLDLDQFKIINDTNGHYAGDELLTQVSQVLKENLQPIDFLCRIGGDEFTIIIQYEERRAIEQLAIKINQVVSKLEYQFNHKIYKVSISIGIAIYPQHGTTINELLSNADLAMYQAKEMGGAQYHIFSPAIQYHERLTQTRYWKDKIEEALAHDHFLLLYQPILDIQNQVISHYECLIRMIETKDNTGKMIMPDEFIGFAEELGLIGKIDRWVIKAAIQKQAELTQKNNDCKLAINLSGWSLNDEAIFEDIATQLALKKANPQQLIFEITETSAVSNFLAAQNLIKNIKNLGCALALDDFGVGFSSFYYLKHLPVDYVKIDGSFVKHVDKNSDDKIFVKALTEVSQALGKKVVAEFVENEAILTILKEFGIEYAQGYYIGKPDHLN